MSQEDIDWYRRAFAKDKEAVVENREADRGYDMVIVRCPCGIEDDDA